MHIRVGNHTQAPLASSCFIGLFLSSGNSEIEIRWVLVVCCWTSDLNELQVESARKTFSVDTVDQRVNHNFLKTNQDYFNLQAKVYLRQLIIYLSWNIWVTLREHKAGHFEVFFQKNLKSNFKTIKQRTRSSYHQWKLLFFWVCCTLSGIGSHHCMANVREVWWWMYAFT